MTKVIGVRFKANGKSYYFSPGELELQQGDHVIVETARGTECGEVAKGPHDVPDSSIVKPLKTVTRMADAVDVRRMQQNRADEKRAFSVCEERIAKHKLDMKLVDVEYTLDRNKILFYFTADGRIDFRDLVKDLAGVFPHAHRAAADRRTGREQNAGRLGYLRPAVLLQPFSAGFPAGVHQNGQGTGTLAQSGQDQRQLRPPDVLSCLRAAGI